MICAAALIDQLVSSSEIFLPLFVAFLGLIYFMRRSVSSVLSSLTACMEQIAGAQLDANIPGLERSDDIGRMARRVAQFSDNSVEKRALEARAEADRTAVEAERATNEAARAKMATQTAAGGSEVSGGRVWRNSPPAICYSA